MILNMPEAPAAVAVPEGLRRLKWNEVVRHGDFVENGRQGMVPWEGPGGFRAGSYVKAIYRRKARRAPATKESK